MLLGQHSEPDYNMMMLGLLQYIYFDTNSAEIPTKYIQYTNSAAASKFTEDSLRTLHEVHYQYLNILGSRLTKGSGSENEPLPY